MQICKTKTESKRICFKQVVDVQSAETLYLDGKVRLLGHGCDGYTYVVWLDLDEIQKILDTRAM